jgi:hypothetical protein
MHAEENRTSRRTIAKNRLDLCLPVVCLQAAGAASASTVWMDVFIYFLSTVD